MRIGADHHHRQPAPRGALLELRRPLGSRRQPATHHQADLATAPTARHPPTTDTDPASPTHPLPPEPPEPPPEPPPSPPWPPLPSPPSPLPRQISASGCIAVVVRAPRGELVQHAPGDDDLALARGQVEPGTERLLALDLDLDLVRAAGDRLAEPEDHQPVANLQPVVCVGLDVERDEPLRDQVAAMDAGEPLGEDAADAKLQGSQGGVLAAGALPVVL